MGIKHEIIFGSMDADIIPSVGWSTHATEKSETRIERFGFRQFYYTSDHPFAISWQQGAEVIILYSLPSA
jgi:hypothetical protein